MSEHVNPSSPASQEYQDVAFAESMMAHHEVAIEMATTQLKYGGDPEICKLAEDITKAQQPDIDLMQVRLKRTTETDPHEILPWLRGLMIY